MSEAAFTLLGATFVVLVVLPVLALLVKWALVLLEREDVGGPLHGLNLRYLLLAGSSILPLAWLLSAGLHQAESGEMVLACLFDHETAARCFEPVFFALTLGAWMLVSSVVAMRSLGRARVSTSEMGSALAARIDG